MRQKEGHEEGRACFLGFWLVFVLQLRFLCGWWCGSVLRVACSRTDLGLYAGATHAAGFSYAGGYGVSICTPTSLIFLCCSVLLGFLRGAARVRPPCEATFGFGVGFLAFGFFKKISTARP